MFGLIKSAIRTKLEDNSIRLQNIKNQLVKNVGKYALLREKEGRQLVVYFIQLIAPNRCEYFCYDNTGNVRCRISKYINPIDVLTNVQQLVFLDGDGNGRCNQT